MALSNNPSPSSEEKYSLPIMSLSAVNVSSFVSSKLWADHQANNYSSWKQQMLCLIQSHDLVRFIDDRPNCSAATDDDKYFAHRKTDILLKGWILGTLSDAVLNTVANCATAKDVWLELEKNFTESAEAGQPLNVETDTLAQKDLNEYLPLYKAILQCNWGAAKEILDKDPRASKARINSSNQTTLHVAVATGESHDFVKELVGLTPDDELMALQDDNGNTALSIAAAAGNKEAATILVKRMPNLLYISNSIGNFPVQQAALFANRDMLRDLISLTKDDSEINPYAGIDGLRLLIYTINARFFDAALFLVEKYPHLAKLKLPDSTSALKSMATVTLLQNYKASKANLSKRSDFSRTPVETTLQPRSARSNIGDIEEMAHDANQGVLDAIVTEASVGIIKSPRLLLIEQAIQLIKCLCKKMASMSHKGAADIYVDAIMAATELGSHVVVEQILEAFPDAIYYSTPSFKQSILHIAAQNRSFDVFNLIYQKKSGQIYLHSDTIDSDGNNPLHVAAKLAPSHKLKGVSSAALQMWHEMDWYKRIESIVHPNCRDQPNQSGKTPKMVFEEEHKKLKEDAEKWTRDMANSCMVVAALIAGVAFAGVITVPGGNDSSSGFPIFSTNVAFKIYEWAIYYSLTLAVNCLLQLLLMLISPHADEDFFWSLPGKIRISLVTLFFSVACMIVSSLAAFGIISSRRVPSSEIVWEILASVLPYVILFVSWIRGPLRPYFYDIGYGTIKSIS